MAAAIDTAPLREAAEREIADGLAACQLAVAREGQVEWARSFGAADDDTRFCIASVARQRRCSSTSTTRP